MRQIRILQQFSSEVIEVNSTRCIFAILGCNFRETEAFRGVR